MKTYDEGYSDAMEVVDKMIAKTMTNPHVSMLPSVYVLQSLRASLKP